MSSRAGDTLLSIAVAYDVSPWKIANMNALEAEGKWLSIGQELLIRVASEPESEEQRRAHVVKRGDTINVIAVRYRVRPADIVERNRLVNGGRTIYPGQELIIPLAG